MKDFAVIKQYNVNETVDHDLDSRISLNRLSLVITDKAESLDIARIGVGIIGRLYSYYNESSGEFIGWAIDYEHRQAIYKAESADANHFQHLITMVFSSKALAYDELIRLVAAWDIESNVNKGIYTGYLLRYNL